MRHHSNWIHDFVRTVGPKTESPERFLYWAAVATVAGAIRRRCFIEMGTFQIYANWYLVLVGPPGLVKKSTTIDIATKLLRGVEGVVFGPDVVTWQEFIAWVARSDDTFNRGGTGTHLFEQQSEQTCAVTFAISEFGTFFDPQDRAMLNMLTELWDGRDVPFIKSTKTQGQDVIKAPFVNLISGTTPAWVADNIRNQIGGWGLSSRIIFLFCDHLEKLIPLPDEAWGPELHTWAAPFQQDLSVISQLEGKMVLPEETRQVFRPWYAELQHRIESFGKNLHADKWTAYFLQRKQNHVLKLALILSIAEGSSLVIAPHHLQEAIQRCDQVEDELSSIFNSARDVDSRRQLYVEVTQGLVKGLLRSGGCPADRIYQFTYRFMNGRQADDLVSQMVKAGYLEKLQQGTQIVLRLLPAAEGLLPVEELAAIKAEIARELGLSSMEAQSYEQI